jgi:hypothetical protein
MNALRRRYGHSDEGARAIAAKAKVRQADKLRPGNLVLFPSTGMLARVVAVGKRHVEFRAIDPTTKTIDGPNSMTFVSEATKRVTRREGQTKANRYVGYQVHSREPTTFRVVPERILKELP